MLTALGKLMRVSKRMTERTQVPRTIRGTIEAGLESGMGVIPSRWCESARPAARTRMAPHMAPSTPDVVVETTKVRKLHRRS
ncbi:hypothetical protein GCM10010404_78530 [Nonomuraea africana]|uniref:Uncharacterized protein n=1 Tax=Nonomuraea africana TaxID=46171 RepID=A0ABR9KIV1_9ACTN|nr:hypothetical protein [Nonomuraea africana]MBE1561947.1 hypothetical protein [Nonomuraea africana]